MELYLAITLNYLPPLWCHMSLLYIFNFLIQVPESTARKLAFGFIFQFQKRRLLFIKLYVCDMPLVGITTH
jgi:hypothetical protein